MFLRILSVFLFILFSISKAENPIDNDFDAGNVGETTATMFSSKENEQSTKTPIGRRVLIGCSEQDHRSCDDVCKGDSFWYGFCASWDGRDLQCSCMAYKEPLDGSICGAERQEKCGNECREKGQEAGGYCAVFPSNDDPRGEPKCMCFDKPALNSK